MIKRNLLVLTVAVILSGCDILGRSAAPTAYPSGYVPTVVYLTAQAIDSTKVAALPSTETPTATAAFIPMTLAPTGTPTAGLGVPLGAIQIRAPGPMSRIVSPLQMQVVAVAGASRIVDLDLYGEDGRLLGHSAQSVAGSREGDRIALKMRFEIRAVGENGFLQVSTRDAEGVVRSLVTLPILLLSNGAEQINPAGNTIYERVVFSRVPDDEGASGGVLAVEGQFMPYNRQPVILWLKAEDGRTLSQRVLQVTGSDWQSFSTTLPYKVDRSTAARLVVQQADDVLGREAYVYTRGLTLNP